MKKLLLTSGVFISTLFVFGQQTDNAADETAKTYIRQGDYQNAVVVLNQALQKDNQNLEMLKDLAFAYYLSRDYQKSLAVAKPLVNRPDADVQSYQILGMIYKGIEEKKDCEKMYRQGLKRFPNSGVLYNELGEVLGTESGNEAIKLWEKGIEVDPGYSSNYYNASLYYYSKNEKVWTVIYGEIFVNIESYSARTEHIKDMVTEGYKRIFSDPALLKGQGIKNDFAAAFISNLSAHSDVVSGGITAESLTTLRSGFVLTWFEKYAKQYPFRLFDYMHQLINLDMFEAYNQWLFGATQNTALFQAWTKSHADAYNKFLNFQRNRIFKLPAGQYYQTEPK
ncbi:MAG TPA: tetratricopeptide repeat protein [Puia sp.]|nr:tetratricopeptide repeat protein [Puia sp.]